MSIVHLEGVFFLHLTLWIFVESNIGRPPAFLKTPPKQIIFRLGTSVTLECLASGRPNVTYSWKKNGVVLDTSALTISPPDGGSIRIPQAAPSDEGFYQCTAANRYGVALSNTSHLHGAVLQPVGLTQVVNQQEVKEGEALVIRASNFVVIPRPRSADDFIWMKFAGEMNNLSERVIADARIQIADNGDLHFAYVLPSDALDGRLYLSTVFNSFLSITYEGNYTRLTVKDNPYRGRDLSPVVAFASVSPSPALEGQSVRLRCFFSGRPEPYVAWIRTVGEFPLTGYALSRLDTELTFEKVSMSDAGEYSCSGTNIKSSTTHSLSVHLEEEPRFRRPEDGPHEANVSEGDSVEFRCNASAVPPAEVIWIVNGRRIHVPPPVDNNTAAAKVEISANGTTLTINRVCGHRCPTDNEYPWRQMTSTDTSVIQCNASNRHGYVIGTGFLYVISSVDDASCEEADNSCGEADNSCGEADDSCGEVDNRCGEVDNSCGEADNSCGEVDNSCGEAENSCGEVDKSCGEADTAAVRLITAAAGRLITAAERLITAADRLITAAERLITVVFRIGGTVSEVT